MYDRTGQLASGAEDGFVNIWDTTVKKRVKQLPRMNPSIVTCLAWNESSQLAIAVSDESMENQSKSRIHLKDL